MELKRKMPQESILLQLRATAILPTKKKTTHIPKKLLFFQKGTILNVVQMRFFFKTSHFSCEDLLLKKQNMLIAINCVRQREL